MASIACHARTQMWAMTPVDLSRQAIDPHPRNWFLALSKITECLNGWFILCNGGVAKHAFRGLRQAHLFSGIGIGMATFALQPFRKVGLVAKWNWLRGRYRLAGFGLGE